MKHTNKQNSHQEHKIDASNYLVTQGMDPNEVGEDKLKSDLSLLSKAEEKKKHRIDISRGIQDTKVKRAVSSLKLSNPFKGY